MKGPVCQAEQLGLDPSGQWFLTYFGHGPLRKSDESCITLSLEKCTYTNFSL